MEVSNTATTMTVVWTPSENEQDLALMDQAERDFIAGLGAPAKEILRRVREDRCAHD